MSESPAESIIGRTVKKSENEKLDPDSAGIPATPSSPDSTGKARTTQQQSLDFSSPSSASSQQSTSGIANYDNLTDKFDQGNVRLDTVYSLYDNKLAQKEDVSHKVSFKDGRLSIDFHPTDSFGDDEAQTYRYTLKTTCTRISRIALNCNCNPALPSADDTVDPVTGETIDFPFVTTQMKEDEGYFDRDERELNDSDLGGEDTVSTNLEEAYYASYGETFLAGSSDAHRDFDPAACELTIDSFSEINSCDDMDCPRSSECTSDKLYSEGLTTWLKQLCAGEPPAAAEDVSRATMTPTTRACALYVGQPNNHVLKLNRNYDDDIAEAYRAMDQRLHYDTETKSQTGPLSDFVLDSGTNIHLLTQDDARRFFNALRRTRMSVIGISGISEKCSNEGRITLLVRDNTGKHLNLSLGIGYSTKSTPRSLISISRLLKEGVLFHFEKGNCYLETKTKEHRRKEWAISHSSSGHAQERSGHHSIRRSKSGELPASVVYWIRQRCQGHQAGQERRNGY